MKLPRQPSFCKARQVILDYLSTHSVLNGNEITALSNSSGVSIGKLVKALSRLSRFKVITLTSNDQYQLGTQSLQSLPEEELYTKLYKKGPLPLASIRESLGFSKNQLQSSLNVLRNRGVLLKDGSLYSVKSPEVSYKNPPSLKTPSPINEVSDLETLISSVKANQTAFDSAKKLADVLRTQADNLHNRANNIEAIAKNALEKAKEALRSKLGNLI
jgi:hypothetical protein